MTDLGFPNVSAPLVDPNTGIITRAWLRFVQGIFERTGGTLGNNNVPPVTVTPGGSPFTFQASSFGFLIVSGGGVSKMQFTRDGVNFYPVGQFYASHPLDNGDKLIITYPGSPPRMVFVAL